VSLRRHRGWLEVTVSDDGVGGAQIDAGSGLRGLSDRLAALEGELSVASPLGEGTRLAARIPTRGPED
jgi:signal transduction histidine kinase